MKPSEILRAGLNLLETKGWTQKAYARNVWQMCVNRADEATCFCGIGSIRVAAFDSIEVCCLSTNFHPYSKAREFLDRAIEPNDRESWAPWQDREYRTFAEIKEKFLEAINLAEQQEKGATL
jgi:hypothetical protein